MLLRTKFRQRAAQATKMNVIFRLILLSAFVLLTACGGGDETIEDGLTVKSSDESREMSIEIQDTEDNSIFNLPPKGTATVVVTITSDEGTPIKNRNVNFTAEDATLETDSANTGPDGVAEINFEVGETKGTGQITAEATVITADGNTEQLTLSIDFAVGGTTEPPPNQEPNVSKPKLSLKLLDDNNNEIIEIEKGSKATIEASLQDSEGNPVTGQFVQFSIALDNVTLEPSTGSVLTGNDGKAKITLSTSSSTEESADQISATVESDGNSLEEKFAYQIIAASEVSNPISGAIEFVSASPTSIALRNTGGAGLSEFSKVTFKLVGVDGKPISGETISFTLSKTTNVGGIDVYPPFAVTDGEGLASTTLQAGSIPTSVSLKATAKLTDIDGNDKEVFTYSSQLAVHTGLPDQNSLSISLSTINPEAWNYDGVEVDVTARFGDAFNNWVPDGTPVYFTTEGGSIEPSCLTVNSACTVKWISQAPRPTDHRVTILAHALGSESFIDIDSDGLYTNADGEPYRDVTRNNVYDEPFTDTDGDGRFDEPFVGANFYTIGTTFIDYNANGVFDGELDNPTGETDFVDSNNGNQEYDGAGRIPAGEFYSDINANNAFDGPGFPDLGEPFLDENEDGARDVNERYVDTNNDGAYNQFGDEKFNGYLCVAGNNCSSKDMLHIRDSAILIMSGSDPVVTLTSPDRLTTYAKNGSQLLPIEFTGGSIDIIVHITDTANQVLPAETTISISSDTGKLLGGGEYEIPNTVGVQYSRTDQASEIAIEGAPTAIRLTLIDDDTLVEESGILTIKITLPSGLPVLFPYQIRS